MRLLPSDYERLVEPMAGSAALFFAVRPQRAVLADLNPDLVNFYRSLKERSRELIPRLLQLRASRKTYYSLRDSSPRSPLARAIRFAYLNRLCWNAVHRVNRNGEFNVPMGSRRPKLLWAKEDLIEASALLKRATLLEGDFEETASRCREGDIVYFDPPYPKTGENDDWFNRYTATRFSDVDHERLAQVLSLLDERGIKVIVTLASQRALAKIYPRNFQRLRIVSASLIAASSHARRRTFELVLRNYE